MGEAAAAAAAAAATPPFSWVSSPMPDVAVQLVSVNSGLGFTASTRLTAFKHKK